MDMGPLVTKAHYEKVKGYVDQGVKEGATLVVDGRTLKVAGHRERLLPRPMPLRPREAFGWSSTRKRSSALSSASSA